MLYVNDLIENSNGDIERVLWVDEKYKFAYLININDNKFSYKKRISMIENDIEDGMIEVLTYDPYNLIIFEDEIPEKHRTERNNRWLLISQMVLKEPNIYTSEKLEIIRQSKLPNNLSETTIIRYLKRYFKRGLNKNALLPDFTIHTKKISEKPSQKRGRKSINSHNNNYIVDYKTKKKFRAALNFFYFNSSNNSLQYAYEQLLFKYFSTTNINEDGKEIISLKASYPSIRQFRYFYQQEKNIKKEICSRKGIKYYEKNNRGLLGNSANEVRGPGDLFQIDTTICDIYLCSLDRTMIVGRPVLYLVVDVYSKVISGLSIGWNSPSLIGGNQALFNAFTDKTKFCKEHNIDLKEGQWTKGVCESLLCDRGEYESVSAESLTELGIKVLNNQSQRSDLKGIVERMFKYIQEHVNPLIGKGTIDVDYVNKNKSDYRLDTLLDINQFYRAVILFVIHYNTHHYLSEYIRGQSMIKDDVKPIPIELWKWGIKNRSGKLKMIKEDLLRLHMMPSGLCRVTSKGIKFKGLLYGSLIGMKENWFSNARTNNSWEIKVSYDPRKVDFIYIKGEGGRTFEKCYLLYHQERFKGYSFEEVKLLRSKESNMGNDIKGMEINNKMNLINDFREIIKEADVINSNAIQTVSNMKKLHQIQENREIHKIIENRKNAIELDDQYDIEVIEEEMCLTDLELMIQMQNKELKD